VELKVTRFEIRDDAVATIWLNRPGRGNSWTNRMNTAYQYLMAKLDADPDVRAVVVTGAGRQFCLGADAKALGYYTETDKEYLSTVNLAEEMKDIGFERRRTGGPGAGPRLRGRHLRGQAAEAVTVKPVLGPGLTLRTLDGNAMGESVTLPPFGVGVFRLAGPQGPAS
jgi:hypothetical protein